MEEENAQLEECLNYFRSNSVYEKLFQKIRRKYESLGRFGGSVVLEKLTIEEKEKIGGFLGKDYRKQKTITVSIQSIERAIMNSRFAGCTIEEIIVGYFGEMPVAKKDQIEKEKKTRDDFFRNLIELCDIGNVKKWIQQDIQKSNSFIQKQYKKYGNEIEVEIKMVNEVSKKFPAVYNKTELLPVFAAKITGDPHYFDKGKRGEVFLSSYLKFLHEEEMENWLSQAEISQQLYSSKGILRDPFSNSCLVYGVKGLKKNKECHKGMEGFFEEQESCFITLQTADRLERIYACKNQVYVMENPAVFAYCIQKYPNRTFLCGNGQLRLAVLKTMDLFSSDTIFYYAGDYDPEGLQIAERLKCRYGQRVHFWNYSVENYKKYLSNVKISENRLAILDKIQSAELQEIKIAMMAERKATYQEAMLESYQIE